MKLSILKHFAFLLTIGAAVTASIPSTVMASTQYESEDNDSPANADMLQFGQTVKGMLEEDDYTQDADYYKFEIKDNGYCTIKFCPDLSAKEAYADEFVIELMDNDRNIIYSGGMADPEFRALRKLSLSKGVYYIAVIPNTYTPTYYYNLTVSFIKDNRWITDEIGHSTRKTIVPGNIYFGSLLNDEDLDIFRCPLKSTERATVSFMIDPEVSTADIGNGYWTINIYDANRNKRVDEIDCVTNKTIRNIKTNTGAIDIQISGGAERCPYRIKVTTFDDEPPKPKTYTVIFKDGCTGGVLKTQKVELGKSASAPKAPVHRGFKFKGWSSACTNIRSNKTITANYSQIHVKKISAKKKITLKCGKRYKIKVKVAPSNAYNKSMVYKSSKKRIATVTKTGVIKARKKGKCYITVTSKDGKKKAKIKVVVK